MKKKPRSVKRQARECIEKLYTLGFTPGEISYYVDWIKLDTIKRYCRGLEVKDTTQKETVLGLLEEYVNMDGDWDELESYIENKKEIQKGEPGLEELKKLQKQINEFDIDLKELDKISTKLYEVDRDWGWLLEQVLGFFKLIEQGWTPEDLAVIKEKTEGFGVRSLIENIFFAYSKEQIKKALDEELLNIEKLHVEQRKIQNQIDTLRNQKAVLTGYIKYAELLQEKYHFDLNALQTILAIAENGEDPIYVLDQVNKYLQTEELDARIKAQQEALHEIINTLKERETNLSELDKKINEANRKIGAIEERHRRSQSLQLIAELLDNPTGAKITPQAFIPISLSLIVGIRDYAYTHSTSLTNYNNYVKRHIDNAATNLTLIISG